jgi:hypothetical protein
MTLRTLLMVSSTLGVAGGILVSLLMLWVVQEPDPSRLPREPLKVDDRPLPLPRTLGEALLRLDKVLSDDNRRRIRSLPDARAAVEFQSVGQRSRSCPRVSGRGSRGRAIATSPPHGFGNMACAGLQMPP